MRYHTELGLEFLFLVLSRVAAPPENELTSPPTQNLTIHALLTLSGPTPSHLPTAV